MNPFSVDILFVDIKVLSSRHFFLFWSFTFHLVPLDFHPHLLPTRTHPPHAVTRSWSRSPRLRSPPTVRLMNRSVRGQTGPSSFVTPPSCTLHGRRQSHTCTFPGFFLMPGGVVSFERRGFYIRFIPRSNIFPWKSLDTDFRLSPRS